MKQYFSDDPKKPLPDVEPPVETTEDDGPGSNPPSDPPPPPGTGPKAP